MIIISKKKIDYTKPLKPIYINSIEANHIYLSSCAEKAEGKIEYKLGKEWVEFTKISTQKAVLSDSLFVRYMKKSITRISDDTSKDFIILKFDYDAVYKIQGIDQDKVNKHTLRNLYYQNGVTYKYLKTNKQGEVVDENVIHYKMLMRSPGKAKDGECIFIRDSLHHKAINYLTMGMYDLMDEQSKDDPDKVFKLVELSAYLTLTTATAIKYIHIPLENILIVKDEEVYSDEMRAAIVRSEDVTYFKDVFKIDFDNTRTEKIINKRGYTFNEETAKKTGLILIAEKTKEALKQNGIRVNGKYPGFHDTVEMTKKECVVRRENNVKIKNVLWDGMGLIDDSIFPKDMDGFIYCRSHFFKSCLFRGNVQSFFRDYCREHDLDFDRHTVEKVDMFGRQLKLSEIKVIITDKSIKWLKFVDMMGGTEEKAYKYYYRYMKRFDNCFSIVKTSHTSKLGELQLTTYQMNNSLPTTDRDVLKRITDCSVNYYNELKTSDEAYLKYLDMKKNKMNINEILIELVRWNPDFVKTALFRTKKTRDISNLKEGYFKQGRLLQDGDNLTIMDNPIALLLKAVGDNNPLDEGCFEIMEDGVQCYAPRFAEGEQIAAFRSPHNSPNNIIHLYNAYPERLLRYFPDIGRNVIVFNAIKTDTQARLSGHDVDSDFVYVTNQKDVVNLARKAYTEFPTIINEIQELNTSDYRFTLSDYANMDNKIADAQAAIGTSTDTAQLALSYYYDEGMTSKALEDCFIILSVIGQISIDLAKKNFDIDVVKEIRRIKRLPCMRDKDIPLFYSSVKESRNNKKFNERMIRAMNCPMDIMVGILEDKCIKYSGRVLHKPLRDFWNKDIKDGSGNKYKKKKVIEEAVKYNESIRKLESSKDKMDDNTFFLLKNRIMAGFLNRVDGVLDQETIMQLVFYAMADDNIDVRAAILKALFELHYDMFMNCFVHNCAQIGQKISQEVVKTA